MEDLENQVKQALKESRKSVSLREIADDDSTISSTRWAFASIIKFDLVMIVIAVIIWAVFTFLDKSTDGLFTGISMLLGIPTALLTTSKALQGFENHNKED